MAAAAPAQHTVGATALLVAAARARESHRPPEHRLFEDSFASKLATDLGQRFLEALGEVYGDVEEQVAKFAVRTRYLDDRILAHRSGPRQLVILGVGCDTRPYRLPLPGVHVFEVDTPAVLAWRSAQLKEAVALCHRVSGIPADLRTDDWESALCAQGFSPAEPSTWLLEGLLMYLTMDDAGRLLAAVRRLAGP
eukprot:EG_transcript_32343